MKKVLLSICLLLGLVTLSSCGEESVNITFTDSLGNEKTISVEATEDQEIIQGVIDFANQASYENMNEISIQSGFSLSATLNSDADSLFSGNTIQASAIANLDLNVNEGMSFSFAADAVLGSQSSAMCKVNAYYDQALDTLANPASDLYFDLTYGLTSSTGEDMNFSQKKVISVEDILDSLEDEIELPDLPDFDFKSISLEEIMTSYPNSKIVISEVQNDVIRIKLSLAILDIVNLVKEEVGTGSEFEVILQLIQSVYDYTDTNKVIEITYAVEAKTGRACGYSVKLDDPELINLLVLYLNVEGLLPEYIQNLAAVFSFEFEISIQYENVVVKKLSSSEKAQYSSLN